MEVLEFQGEEDCTNSPRNREELWLSVRLSSEIVALGTSACGKSWREVACEENNEQLNDSLGTVTVSVAGGGECRFSRRGQQRQESRRD
jgi:hypothetical protein